MELLSQLKKIITTNIYLKTNEIFTLTNIKDQCLPIPEPGKYLQKNILSTVNVYLFLTQVNDCRLKFKRPISTYPRTR